MRRVDQIIILGIGDCFKPFVDFHDDKEVLFIHSAPEDCHDCGNYWNNISAKWLYYLWNLNPLSR